MRFIFAILILASNSYAQGVTSVYLPLSGKAYSLTSATLVPDVHAPKSIVVPSGKLEPLSITGSELIQSQDLLFLVSIPDRGEDGDPKFGLEIETRCASMINYLDLDSVNDLDFFVNRKKFEISVGFNKEFVRGGDALASKETYSIPLDADIVSEICASSGFRFSVGKLTFTANENLVKQIRQMTSEVPKRQYKTLKVINHKDSRKWELKK